MQPQWYCLQIDRCTITVEYSVFRQNFGICLRCSWGRLREIALLSLLRSPSDLWQQLVYVYATSRWNIEQKYTWKSRRWPRDAGEKVPTQRVLQTRTQNCLIRKRSREGTTILNVRPCMNINQDNERVSQICMYRGTLGFLSCSAPSPGWKMNLKNLECFHSCTTVPTSEIGVCFPLWTFGRA